jgi:hypothetical protein
VSGEPEESAMVGDDGEGSVGEILCEFTTRPEYREALEFGGGVVALSRSETA